MLHIPIVHADNVCKQMPQENLKLPRARGAGFEVETGGLKRMKKREETKLGGPGTCPPEKF